MNFATLLYAFPVSVSMALPIVISYEIGANRLKRRISMQLSVV